MASNTLSLLHLYDICAQFQSLGQLPPMLLCIWY